MPTSVIKIVNSGIKKFAFQRFVEFRENLTFLQYFYVFSQFYGLPVNFKNETIHRAGPVYSHFSHP